VLKVAKHESRIKVKMPIFNKKFQGQQLSEYSLAIALIAVALITACTLFGASASDAIGSMVAGMNQAPPGKVAGPDPGHLTLQSAADGKSASIAAISANGSLMTYANSLTSAIETSGANGTTTEILALLDNYINQSLDSGKLSPEQASYLTALSKQGYELANIEAVIEDMIKNNPKALGQPYTYNGVTYSSALTLALQIGFDPVRKTNDAEVGRFVELYNQALNHGALNDPEAKNIVMTLSNQIINIANGVEGAAVQIHNGNEPASNYNPTLIAGLYERDRILGTNTQNVLDSKTIEQLGASKTTEIKSSKICAEDAQGCASIKK
jgi:Flp pilus assembly pilin Flp